MTQTRAVLDSETLKRRYLLANDDEDEDDDRSSNTNALSICYSNSSADSTFIGSELSEDNPTINDESFDISKDEVNFMNSTYQTAFSESFSGTMNTISRFHLLVLLS